MNKFLNKITKTFSSGKTVTVIALIIVTLFTIGIIYNLTTVFKKTETIDSAETSDNTIFVTYDVYKNDIALLFRDKNNKFIFTDSDNNVIYSTEDYITNFKILSPSEYVYIYEDINDTYSVRYVNIEEDYKNRILYNGEEIAIEAEGDHIYIINKVTGEVLSGTYESLQTIQTNTSVDKVILNKGHLFLINYSMDINYNPVSTIYTIKDKTVVNKIATMPGKIQSINVDYKNDNKIYLLKEVVSAEGTTNKSSNSTKLVSSSLYIENRSTTENAETEFGDLPGFIISLKDKMIFIDKTSKEISLINSNMKKIKSLGTCNKEIFWSFVKENHDSTSIYYVDTKGKISSV